jgi:hypothetical protein
MAQTSSEISGLNKDVVPVERLIFDGLQRSFLRVFKTPSVWVTSTDKVKAVSRLFDGKPVSYPYVCLTLNSSTTSEDRQNSHATARRGMTTTISTDSRRLYRVHFLPEVFEIGVELMTNNYEDLLRFNNSWKFARRLGHLKFEAAYGSLSFGVGVDQDATVTFPLRTAEPDEVQEYVLITTLNVLGYISRPTLLEGQVADTVVADLDVTKQGDTFGSFRSSREVLFDSIAVPEVPTNMR